jgi:NADH:ubiquinone oxidoreductase subunit E
MDPIHVTICAGTACVVMDGSQLALLEEHLPARLRGRVKLRGERCLELCQSRGAAGGPYVLVQGEPMEQATFERIAARIEALLEAGG